MKFFAKLILLIAVVLTGFYFLQASLDNYYKAHYVSCNKSGWILSKKAQQYDFAIIGSSRALNNVYVPSIEKEINSAGINLGLSGANYAENFLTLREFLNKGNAVRKILIQADVYGMDSPHSYNYPFNEYNYIHLLKDDTVSEIFKDHVNLLKYYMWKLVPYTKYAEFSNRYSLYKFLKGGYECSPDEWDRTGGSELLDTTSGDKFSAKRQDYSYKINSSDSFYLDQLIKYCRKKNIAVEVFSSPEKPEFIEQQVNRKEIYGVINSICKQNHVANCFTGWKLQDSGIEEHFRDNTHLDSTGAKLFSVLLAKHLKSSMQ